MHDEVPNNKQQFSHALYQIHIIDTTIIDTDDSLHMITLYLTWLFDMKSCNMSHTQTVYGIRNTIYSIQYTWQSSYYVIAESPNPQHTSPVSYGGASSPLSWFSMPTFGNGSLQGLETWLLTHTHTHTGPNAANDMHSPSAQLKNDTNPQTLKQTQACWTPKNRTLTSGALPCDSEDASFFGGCLSHCQKLLPSEMVSVIQPMALCVLPRVATLPRVACGKGKTITWTLNNLILSLTTEHTLCLFMPSFFHGTLKKALCNLRMLPTWAKNKKS